MPRVEYQTTRTSLAAATAASSCILAWTYGSWTCTRRVATRRPSLDDVRPRSAASIACRVISSCALAVSDSASSGNSVDSAFASRPRIRRSARSSLGVGFSSHRERRGPHCDGGGRRLSIRGGGLERAGEPEHDPPRLRGRRVVRPGARRHTTAGSRGRSAPSSRQLIDPGIRCPAHGLAAPRVLPDQGDHQRHTARRRLASGEVHDVGRLPAALPRLLQRGRAGPGWRAPCASTEGSRIANVAASSRATPASVSAPCAGVRRATRRSPRPACCPRSDGGPRGGSCSRQAPPWTEPPWTSSHGGPSAAQLDPRRVWSPWPPPTGSPRPPRCSASATTRSAAGSTAAACPRTATGGGPAVVDGADLAGSRRRCASRRSPGTTRRRRPATGSPGSSPASSGTPSWRRSRSRPGPFRLVSLMSREAADELGLEVGARAVATVKATQVSVDVP